MKCSKCGAPLNPNDTSCPVCGAAVETQSPSVYRTPVTQDRNFLLVLLLSIVTCGIYEIYFWYKFTEDINVICDGDGKQTTNYIIVILLSIVTCGIYGIYWYYCLGNRMAENAPRYGLSFQENGTTILLWYLLGSLLCGLGSLVAMYLLIRNMNELAQQYSRS